MNCLPCQHRGRCGSKTSDDGHQRRLDEHPEKMRQRRETVALAAYAASHPGLYGSAHGKTARLSIAVPIIFGGLFILFFSWLTGAMSACGTYHCIQSTSALRGKADIRRMCLDVRFRG
jgi:hypothetical protein